MPYLITREQAVEAIERETNDSTCLICKLVNGESNYIIERSKNATVFLSAYPRFWGQVMIAPNLHCESFSELDPLVWVEMNKHAHTIASRLESIFNPVRCYVASTGSPQNLQMTCPHLHINVIPVVDPELKPSEVFTWANGLYAGSKEEWKELLLKLKK